MDIRHCQVALGSNIPTSTYLTVSRITTYLDIKVSRIMVLWAVIRGFGPLFHRVETLNPKKTRPLEVWHILRTPVSETLGVS